MIFQDKSRVSRCNWVKVFLYATLVMNPPRVIINNIGCSVEMDLVSKSPLLERCFRVAFNISTLDSDNPSLH